MNEQEDIMRQEWLKGKIEVIGKKTKTGLIKAEDGTLVAFNENAPIAFERLSEMDTVLFTLTKDKPDARGVMQAQQLLPVIHDE